MNMLALIIQNAEKSKAAHPAFLADLKEILAGLEALPESFDEFAASKVQGSTAKEIRVTASTQTGEEPIENVTEKGTEKTGGNSWFGALLKVVEEVISLPGVIGGELGSAIKEITAKPGAQPDTESESLPHSAPPEETSKAQSAPAGSASSSTPPGGERIPTLR